MDRNILQSITITQIPLKQNPNLKTFNRTQKVNLAKRSTSQIYSQQIRRKPRVPKFEKGSPLSPNSKKISKSKSPIKKRNKPVETGLKLENSVNKGKGRRRDKSAFRKTPKSKKKELEKLQKFATSRLRKFNSESRVKEYPDVLTLQYHGLVLPGCNSSSQESHDSTELTEKTEISKNFIEKNDGENGVEIDPQLKKLMKSKKVKFCNLHRRGEFYLLKFFMEKKGKKPASKSQNF